MAYPERHRGKWCARYKTTRSGKYRRKAPPRGRKWTKAQAEHEAWRLERAALGGELPTAEAERLTLAELCRWWLANWCKEPSRPRELSRLKANVLEQPLGTLPLPQVSPEAIEARLREMEAAGAAPASVEHVRRTLRTVFNRAIRANVWKTNPAAEAHARSMDPVCETRPLPADEVARVVAAIAEPWKRDLVVTAFYTLMRKGELLGLPKSAVDLEAGTIRIARSHERSTTKGGHADTLPIAAPLRPYLVHALAAAKGSELVFPGPDGGQRPASTDAVAIVQKALRDAGFVKGWEHLCRRCKGRGRPYAERREERRHDLRCPSCGMRLWAKAVPRPFTFHALRHTGASLLARAGVPIHVLQRALRHRSIDTTVRRYVHLYDDDLRAAFGKLPELPAPEPVQVEAPPLELPAALADGGGRTGAEMVQNPSFRCSARAPGTGVSTADVSRAFLSVQRPSYRPECPPEPKATGSNPVSRANFPEAPPLLFAWGLFVAGRRSARSVQNASVKFCSPARFDLQDGLPHVLVLLGVSNSSAVSKSREACSSLMRTRRTFGLRRSGTPASGFDAPPERRSEKLAYEALRGTGVAADVIVWTRGAFDRRLGVATSLPATIMREGRLLVGAATERAMSAHDATLRKLSK